MQIMIYNPYPRVDLPFGNDNKYFQWLFEALLKVKKRYLTYDVEFSSTSVDIKKEHLERVFAYELYHQWSVILDQQKDNDLILNAEIDKNINETIIEMNKSDNDDSSESLRVNVYPDLVLHQSQGKD